MSDPVIVALIGMGGSVVGSVIGHLASSKLWQYRIEQLEKRVEAHNNLIDRTYKLEKHEGEIDVELENLADAVHKLEKYHA